jgi:ligand-binding sensor domain-containing protein/two-component sensor histidine kinase
MGTRGGGLSRFDGVNFKNFTTKDGLQNNYILALAEDKYGNIWVGSNAGLSRFDGKVFTSVSSSEQNLVVGVLSFDSEGKLWMGTNEGIVIYENQTFINYSGLHKQLTKDVSCLLPDGDTIWAGSDDGLLKIIPENRELFQIRSQHVRNNIRSICKSDNKIYIGTYGGGLFLFNGQAFQNIGNPREIINHVYTDKNGIIWCSTLENGVFTYNPKNGSIKYMNELSGLANNHVRVVYQDDWANIWIGTSGGGVSKYSGKLFETYAKSEGLPDAYIYSVHVDNKKRIWVATPKGISILNDSLPDIIRLSALNQTKVKVINEDKHGNIWFGTEGKGVYVYDGTQLRTFNKSSGLSDNWIRDIQFDSNLNIWVATAGGGITRLSPIESSTLKFDLTIYNNLPDNRLNALHIDKYNRIWFACRSNGVGYILNEQITHFSNENSGLKHLTVRSFTEDQWGRLWIGTAGGGLYHTSLYDNMFDFRQINTKDDLHSDNIYLLIIDKQGNLWAGSESGIDKISFNSDKTINEIKHYGYNEGFSGIETCQNAVSKGVTGDLWFGTINGLMRYQFENKKLNTEAPKLNLTGITLAYNDIRSTHYDSLFSPDFSLLNNWQLPHYDNHLSFIFTGINLSNPAAVKYSYILSGYESKYSPRNNSGMATYSNIPPGNYIFKVRAVNEDGIWSEVREIPFTILKPYWQTLWFRSILIFLLVFAIWLVFYFRIKSIKRKAQIEKEKLEMEKHLLELEHQALRLQMNPHFIFNCLNSIQASILKNQTNEAKHFLSKFAKLMRKTLEFSRKEMISIEDEMAFLEDYVLLENLSTGKNINLKIESSPEIEKEFTLIPSLILQPFVENSLYHGFKNTTIGEISILFDINNNELHIDISDNGIGISNTKKENNTHQSLALQIITERLKLWGDYNFSIEEIIDSSKICGTKVQVKLPYQLV